MYPENDAPSWYCLRSQPKRQCIAAAHLRTLGVEVFNPLIRLKKAHQAAVVLRTEPLFPNYVFARFDLVNEFHKVRYANGISDIVNFGGVRAVVPESEIVLLQERWGEDETLEILQSLEVGEEVRIAGGLFRGVEATVVGLLPARQRVKVLLEFLGGVQQAEISAEEVLPITAHPISL